jgi:hypothetical protein
MIGFYLTVNKGTNPGAVLSLRLRECPTKLEVPGQEGLHVFDDDRLDIVQSNGFTAFNVGTIIYKNNGQKKALESIVRDLGTGRTVQEIMPDTQGQFCLVIYTPKSVFVITDKLGSFPVYKFEDDKTIQISNIFLTLAKLNSVTVNYQAFAEYLSFDYCFDCTFFNEIEHLKRGSIYQFSPDLRIHVYDDFPSGVVFDKYNKLDEIARLTKETLVGNLSFLDSDGRIFADLTGGFDTRTIATMLKSMNIGFETGISGEQVLHESNIAKEVAEALRVKHHRGIKIAARELFRRIVNEHFEVSNGVPLLYHSSELINYYEYIKQNFDIHVTGFAGSQLFDQFLPRLSFFSPRLKHNALFEKTFKFKEIMREELLSEAAYYEKLTRKITAVLAEIGSDIHNEVACFFPVATFNRYYHGSIIGTHNVVLPSYCPYLESNIVKLMIATAFELKKDRTIQRALLTEVNPDVSKIMTSHGYSASLDSRETERAFVRAKHAAKNFGRQIIYELRFPAKIMRAVKNSIGKVKLPTHLELVHRSFWADEVEKIWSDDMEIFEVLDRAKFAKQLARDPYVPKLKAKAIYLNRILNECKPQV